MQIPVSLSRSHKKLGHHIHLTNFFIGILIPTLVIILLGCGASEENKTEPKTIRAARKKFYPAVTALGIIKPQVGAEVRLGARIPGKVEHLHANIGAFVEKGQIIAELEKDELIATVEKRQAELSSAETNLAARKILGPVEIEKAEADLNRLRATYEIKAIEHERQTVLFNEKHISRQALDQIREEMLVAEANMEAGSKALILTRNQLEEDLKLLNAEIESAMAELRISKVELSYSTLRAPIQGIIASVSTQEGETVAVGLSVPTFVTIIDLDRLQVETYVDEVDIGKINIGQKAIFTVEAFPSVDIEGEVVGIYPKAILKENVVFYNVVVKCLKSPEVTLRPEMTANVSIFLESGKDVLAVPISSVKRSGGENLVYLIKKGRPFEQKVQIGLKQGGFLEIVKGLKQDDEVLKDHHDWKGENL